METKLFERLAEQAANNVGARRTDAQLEASLADAALAVCAIVAHKHTDCYDATGQIDMYNETVRNCYRSLYTDLEQEWLQQRLWLQMDVEAQRTALPPDAMPLTMKKYFKHAWSTARVGSWWIAGHNANPSKRRSLRHLCNVQGSRYSATFEVREDQEGNLYVQRTA
jgi:hypothetical protein